MELFNPKIYIDFESLYPELAVLVALLAVLLSCYLILSQLLKAYDQEDEEESQENEEESPHQHQTTHATPVAQYPFKSGSTLKCDSEKSCHSSDVQKLNNSRTMKSQNPTSKSHSQVQKDCGRIGLRKDKRKSVVAEEDTVPDDKTSQPLPGGRVYTCEDEIDILQGTIDYMQSENFSDPLVDKRGIYNFLKKRLRVKWTKVQVCEKIRRMKEKYLKKVKELSDSKGDHPVFQNPHDARLFAMSNKIWGGSICNGPDDANDGADDVERKGVEDEGSFWSSYPFLWDLLDLKNSSVMFLSENVREFLKKNMYLIGSAKISELEMESKNLRLEEIQVSSKKMNLGRTLTELALAWMKKE